MAKFQGVGIGILVGGRIEGVLCWWWMLCLVVVPKRQWGSGGKPFRVGRMKCCRWLWRDGVGGLVGKRTCLVLASQEEMW